MRLLKSLVLYAGLVIAGNPATADVGHMFALANGDLAKIRFHATPKPLDGAVFYDARGKAVTLDDFRGKHVLLNFWALWCPPCVKEMPALNNLDAAIGGNFEVVTIATGRNSKAAVDKFFDKEQLNDLPKLFDPKFSLAQSVGVQGLPVTIFIAPDGLEVARVQGEIVWDSPDAKALIQAWISGV